VKKLSIDVNCKNVKKQNMEAVFKALNIAIHTGDDTLLKYELLHQYYGEHAIINVISEANAWKAQNFAHLIWSFLKINLSEKNYKGETLLNYAIGSEADDEIIEFLLSIPTIDINQNDTDNGGHWFPLKNAVLTRNAPIVRKLLQMGADVNKVDRYGCTVYNDSNVFHHTTSEIQNLLINQDFDINIQDNISKYTPIMSCLKWHQERLTERLIRAKHQQINFDLVDSENRTVLQLAHYKNIAAYNLLEAVRASREAASN
jgi:ankyrin repeat protein